MRILVLTKRQYTGRDLLDDRYGRLFEIPRAMSAAGHLVRGLTLSYRRRPAAPEHALGWESMNAWPFSPWGAAQHLRRIRQLCQEFRPDLVWASSDAWHAIAAWRTCMPDGIPYVVDLYDNYESFGLTKLPGVTALLRVACRDANGLSLIGHNLANYVKQHYVLPPDQPHLILGNAINASQFHPQDRQAARQALGLPANALLVGTAGSLDSGRGIGTLLKATERLVSAHPNLCLALAGPKDFDLGHLTHLPIDYLGVLPPSRVPVFWNALDVAVILNRDSAFGHYCYPQKLQEIIASGVPLVASQVGEVTALLENTPACLTPPDSPTELAKRIDTQIREQVRVDTRLVRTWDQRAAELTKFFSTVISHSK